MRKWLSEFFLSIAAWLSVPEPVIKVKPVPEPEPEPIKELPPIPEPEPESSVPVAVYFTMLEDDKIDIKYSFSGEDAQRFIDLVYYVGRGHLYKLMLDALHRLMKPNDFKVIISGIAALEQIEEETSERLTPKSRPLIKPSDVFNRQQGMI